MRTPIIKYFYLPLLLLLFISCFDNNEGEVARYTKPLEIVKLSDHDYLHTSFIKQQNGAIIPCNGYIFINEGSAIIFDTPLNDSIATQLIEYVQKDLNSNIEGVVINHFHNDAAGGLGAFTQAGIPSYASDKTAALLAKDSVIISNPFKEGQEINVQGATIKNRFFGTAHSPGNIVSYIPSQKVLFGGCMVKSLNSKKGNLEDADVTTWPHTIADVKETYPDAKLIIPGHGQIGGQELLDYTMALFTTEPIATPDNLD